MLCAYSFEGTKLELAHNYRVFDVVVSRSGDGVDSLKLSIAASSFSQAEKAAVDAANEIREIYRKENEGQHLLLMGTNIPFTPADVRKMEVVRSGVRHFKHAQ